MIKIIDFVTNFDDRLWKDCQNLIVESDDQLKDNYINLDLTAYISFPVVIIENKIVCFSGLEVNKDRWGKGIGRCSTRMWIHPEYRHAGKFTSGDKFLNTTYCLPIQLAKAKLIGLDCVFISRESNLKGFEEYLKLIKINSKTDFIMEPNKYNVCGSLDPVPESCKQWIMIHHLTDRGSQLWQNQMKLYMLE